MEDFNPTERTQLRRLPQRGSFEREVVYSILDEGLVCHVGFVLDGEPFVIPTGYGRDGDTLYVHGSAASRMLRTLAAGVRVCLTVTLLDGLVLARSAFHHSMNYRSVAIFGTATVIVDAAEKMEALRVITEQIVPGRWPEVRWPDEAELRKTLVLKLPLTEASAKIRTGPPIDDEPDYELPVWAGEIPLRVNACAPVPDPRLAPDREPPPYVSRYNRIR